jgi:hypothetical protein
MKRWFRREKPFVPQGGRIALPDDLLALGPIYPGRVRGRLGMTSLGFLFTAAAIGLVISHL